MEAKYSDYNHVKFSYPAPVTISHPEQFLVSHVSLFAPGGTKHYNQNIAPVSYGKRYKHSMTHYNIDQFSKLWCSVYCNKQDEEDERVELEEVI